MVKIEVKLNPDVPPTGNDLAIINAARRSFGTRSDWDWQPKHPAGAVHHESYSKEDKLKYFNKTLKEKDKRLIEFLARGMTADDFDDFIDDVSRYGYNSVKLDGPEFEVEFDLLKDSLWQWRNTPTHDTPFSHSFISFEVKAPIFVRAQLVKHEYLVLSEFSRRYITDEVEFFEPDGWRGVAKNKKQGSSDVIPCGSTQDQVDMMVATTNETAVYTYNEMIKGGIAPEQARMVLPQSLMTSWTWSGTLGAFAKMCTLRIHPEAQKEAKVVADAVYTELKKVWPVGAKALVEGV